MAIQAPIWDKVAKDQFSISLSFTFLTREFTFLQFWPAGESHSRGCWRQGGRRGSSGWDRVGARIGARIEIEFELESEVEFEFE